MDPVTAVGLAAAVVQLVQFSAGVVSESVDIHKSTSGSTQQNANLEAFVRKFEDLKIDLDKREAAWASATASPAQRSLQGVTTECSQLSNELLDKLKSIKVNDGHLKSVRTALKSVMAKSTIESMQQRLSQMESHLQQSVLVQMSAELRELHIAKRFDEVDEGHRQLLDALTSSSTAFVAECAKQNYSLDIRFENMRSYVASEQSASRKHVDLTASTLGKRMREDFSDSIQQEGSRIRRHIDDVVNRDSSQKQLEDLKNSLYFPAMDVRQQDIDVKDREAKTYSWILDEAAEEQSAVRYVQWLQTQGGIYWIQGKAGSGKSTLMNIIQQDGRTKDYLQSWAGDTQLIYNSFFFWRSGSQQLQHTLEGLLRTMLYKCLQDAPGLKDVVLSSLVGRSPRPHKYHWSLSELMQCFNRLLTQATVKIALFIDGLDEYSGNYVDLIKLLRTLPRSTDVKICLSSRPETPFVTAFGSSPGLRLQYITQGDISSYIVHRLGEDFSPLSPPHSAHEFSLRQLIGREMVRTANGVFQLVVAVATAVEIDIYEGESDRELWYHIERLPEDLDSLYLQMLEAIKPYRRKQMAQVFILIQTCRSYRTLRAEVLWSSPLLLDKTEREAIEATPTLSPSSSSSRALPFSQDQERLAGSHLQNISRGLLEMNSNKKVQYSHKSVEDFLRLPSTQSWLKQHLPRYGDLEVFQQWLAMTVLHIKWYRRDFFEAQELVHAAFSWAAELTKQQKYPRGALLQELDRVLSLTYVEYLDDLVGSGQLSKERHDVWIEYHWSSAALCRYRTVLPMNQNDAITVLVSCNPLEASLPNESSELVFLTVACWYKLHDVVSGVLEATSDHSLRVQKAKSLMGSFLHFCESEAYVTTLEPFLKTTILLAENGGYVRHDGPGLHPFAHWVVKLWELFIVSGEIAASRSVLDVSRSVIASLLAQSGIANEKTWVASYSAYPVFPFVRLNFAEILNAMGFCDASEPHRAIVSSEVFNLPKRPFPDVWQRPVFVYKDQNDWPARALSSLEEVRDCMELEDFGFDQDFHFDVDYKILSLRFAHGNYCLSDSGGSTEREGKTSNDETTLRNLFEDAVFGLIWGDVEDCQSFNLEYFDDIG